MMGKGRAVHRSGHLDVGKHVHRAAVAYNHKRLIRHDFDTPTTHHQPPTRRKVPQGSLVKEIGRREGLGVILTSLVKAPAALSAMDKDRSGQ
jgi:hypothetical protein